MPSSYAFARVGWRGRDRMRPAAGVVVYGASFVDTRAMFGLVIVDLGEAVPWASPGHKRRGANPKKWRAILEDVDFVTPTSCGAEPDVEYLLRVASQVGARPPSMSARYQRQALGDDWRTYNGRYAR